jgi:Protein of unknown function (DUF2950)
MRAIAILLVLFATTQVGCSRTIQQKDFASAEEATQALVAAARADKTRALVEVLGSDAEPMVDSGDAVQDSNARQRFVKEFETKHELVSGDEGRTTLHVGLDQWPFPYPLVQSNGRWRFDSAAGAEEIINRRVGANELATIQSCLAFVDAQREYYARNPDQGPLLHYAQKLISTEGRKDGLYWATNADEPPSPLGENFAYAQSEGYFKQGASKDDPYHGYLYRLLTAQGPHAPGGAYDYMVRDKMIGGYAIIAIPAEYGNSGVMSFIVSHDGVVYSRDLGPDTPDVAKAIKTFDPDSDWKREAAIEQAQ